MGPERRRTLAETLGTVATRLQVPIIGHDRKNRTEIPSSVIVPEDSALTNQVNDDDFEHPSGYRNLLDSYIESQRKLRETEKNNIVTCTSLTVTEGREEGSNQGDHHMQEQNVSLDDAVKRIVNNSESWGKVREKIRANKLVTSLGVNEVCLSYFQQEAEQIKKERIQEAKKAEAQLSKYSRLRRRLSLF
mmetsp:Transcript_22954/g.28160  ORF Transcript_22954/g.28160 Transcript_22954/m.28160 type:complete len:190 (+) Transcript_22954:187-756(+)